MQNEKSVKVHVPVAVESGIDGRLIPSLGEPFVVSPRIFMLL